MKISSAKIDRNMVSLFQMSIQVNLCGFLRADNIKIKNKMKRYIINYFNAYGNMKIIN